MDAVRAKNSHLKRRLEGGDTVKTSNTRSKYGEPQIKTSKVICMHTLDKQHSTSNMELCQRRHLFMEGIMETQYPTRWKTPTLD